MRLLAPAVVVLLLAGSGQTAPPVADEPVGTPSGTPTPAGPMLAGWGWAGVESER